MWELDYKEIWLPKNWCFWTVVLEKTLESPLDCKEIQPVHPKGDQSCVFFGRNETPVLWPPHAKSWLIVKDSDAGRDWGQEEKGTTEDEMDGWHHRLDGHGFGWTPGVGDGQGGLVCCDSWGHRVGHNWATELKWKVKFSKTFLCLSIYNFIFYWKFFRWNNEALTIFYLFSDDVYPVLSHSNKGTRIPAPKELFCLESQENILWNPLRKTVSGLSYIGYSVIKRCQKYWIKW